MGTKSGDFNQFFDAAEELIKRVADIDSDDIQRVRAKARDALRAAKSTARDGAYRARQQATQAAQSADGLVREDPWATVGIAVLVGLGLGVVLSSAARE